MQQLTYIGLLLNLFFSVCSNVPLKKTKINQPPATFFTFIEYFPTVYFYMLLEPKSS